MVGDGDSRKLIGKKLKILGYVIDVGHKNNQYHA